MTFKNLTSLILSLILVCLFTPGSFSQKAGFFSPINIHEGYQKSTREPSGHPGKNYWQNRADYTIDVSFDPQTLEISGSEKIVYHNHSGDTLAQLLMLLLPDLYKQGTPRDFRVSPGDEHSGIVIRDFSINSIPVDPSRAGSDRMTYDHTSAWVTLNEPLLPGSSLDIKLSWNYTLNKGSNMRTGQVDQSSFFIAYWFPRIGVYDDLEGWNNYTYTGDGEFYNDFGDFDVKINVPRGFAIWATGELQNPELTLSDKVLKKYNEARNSNKPVQIIEKGFYTNSIATRDQEIIGWEFKAENVSDFAFGLSDHYLWDAVTLNVGKSGSEVFLSAAYNPGSDDFYHVLGMAQNAIGYMTEELPGLPFPYPSITVFNGTDEMEYPMMVNDLSNDDLNDTYKLTAHEICHSYFPFLTGCNERKYAWMDEGLTSFFEYNMMRDLVDSSMVSIYFLPEYLEILATERDIPLMTPSDMIRDPEYYAISYAKAVCFYSVLQEEIGRDLWKKGLREFVSRWEGKHPTGFDFLNTITDVCQRDLSWLIQPWMFEFGAADLGIGEVEKTSAGYAITVVNHGNLPVPIHMQTEFSDGYHGWVHGKPSAWADGSKSSVIEIVTESELVHAKLIQEIPMDCNPANDEYHK